MNKQISYKIVSLVFGILVVCFVVGFYVFAWTEPPYGGTCTNPPCPPGGNVPTPLNTGLTNQIKQGNLVANALGTSATSGNALIVPYGNVGIGTTSPSEKLDLGGGNIAMGYQVVIKDCNVSIAANLGQMCNAYCPAGKRVIGGGCWILDTLGDTSGTLQNSHPINNNTGWACAYSNIKISPGVMRVEAICANIR